MTTGEGYRIEDIQILTDLICDGNFEALQGKVLFGKHFRPPKRHNKNIIDEWRMLFKDCANRPALAYAMLVLTVPIRRKVELEKHLELFFRLWREYEDTLLSGLDMRWLVSACDTFAEHSTCAAERGWAHAGSLLINTAKLYESEMLRIDDYPDWHGPVLRVNEASMKRRRGRVFLFDGITPFKISDGGGDMIRTLRKRVNASHPDDPVTARITRELFNRMLVKQTVYNRAREAVLKAKTPKHTADTERPITQASQPGSE